MFLQFGLVLKTLSAVLAALEELFPRVYAHMIKERCFPSVGFRTNIAFIRLLSYKNNHQFSNYCLKFNLPVCVVTCSFNWDSNENAFQQESHLNGLICLFRI